MNKITITIIAIITAIMILFGIKTINTGKTIINKHNSQIEKVLQELK